MISQGLSVAVDGVTLRGTISLPSSDGAHPTVVMHHGFGANRIEAAGLFPQISRRLTQSGIATVAFDRAGQGESDGDFSSMTVSGDLHQAHLLLEAIVLLPEVDPSSVHLLGMSLGSVIASVLAAETAFPVRSLTLWSPAAIMQDDARRGTFAGTPLEQAVVGGWLDKDGTRLGLSFLDDARQFDPYARARGFKGPVRLITAELDPVVPSPYAERYREIYGDRVDITVVPGGDHLWSTIPVRDRLLEETEQFITSVG